MKKQPYIHKELKELPINQVQEDSDQPRKKFGTDGDKNRLKKSIAEHGILQPIGVFQLEENLYTIIDGHRRYRVAKELEFTTVPAIVYQKLKPAEVEISRFELQNNRRPWKPMERSEALFRIKNLMKFQNNQQLADLIGVSKTLVSNSLQLMFIRIDYLEQMEKYKFSESYRIEFVRLKPKIRKIGKFEVQDTIEIIFQKTRDNIIKNAKSFRKLGKIFSRASANETALISFLSDPDMTIDELEKKSSQSTSALLGEQLIKHITENLRKGIKFSPQEKEVFKSLGILFKEIS